MNISGWNRGPHGNPLITYCFIELWPRTCGLLLLWFLGLNGWRLRRCLMWFSVVKKSMEGREMEQLGVLFSFALCERFGRREIILPSTSLSHLLLIWNPYFFSISYMNGVFGTSTFLNAKKKSRFSWWYFIAVLLEYPLYILYLGFSSF